MAVPWRDAGWRRRDRRVAELPADRDIAGLLARADAAMYARKRARMANGE